MRRSIFSLGLVAVSSLVLAATGTGCSSTPSGAGGGGTSDATATTGAGGGAGGSASTTTSSATSSTGSTSSSSATTGATASSSTSGTGGGMGAMADHLLISEISVAPVAGEFIEIWNPTAAAVPLDNYYLSDNSTYFELAQGKAWTPITNNPGTDFLGRFPAGASIAPDQVIVIGFKAGYSTQYAGKCPNFFMSPTAVDCGGAMVPAMLSTEAGSITASSGLSDPREMVMLFKWDGVANTAAKDVDYLTWGTVFEAGSRADKTGVAGYQPDTTPANQVGSVAPPPLQSVERCSMESGEKLTGGNGITGHDETSENLGKSFVVQTTPTPGVKNTCL
ncbi:MAG: lamin tail domain-containing protein [Byssovorax sp.]